ncbi:DUF6855 family protein [Kribbella sp. NPDC056861]|uniref:DUF6855 family protein n=1 Tax=Kribbella sp. NPDC056861 TaxID=3154857 RepID=UPI00343DE4B9
MAFTGSGTKADPWALSTPPGGSQYQVYREDDTLVCQVGSTKLSYQARCIEDLHAMLQQHGDWMLLGNTDEQQPAALGPAEVEHNARNNRMRAL